MNALDCLSLDDADLLAQCAVDTYRASGPGGQKRNKTDSAVRLRHHPTGVAVIGTESRSQHENKAKALKRLRLAIALAVRCPARLDKYVPPPIFGDCVSGKTGKFDVGRRDARYPQLVAIVLDVLAGADYAVRESADALGISTGNFAKFLESDPKMWEAVNQAREERGLKRLSRSRSRK